MHVLALVPAIRDTSPGQRFRIEQWEPELRAEGIELAFEPFEDDAMHDLMSRPGMTAAKMSAVARALGRRVRLLRERASNGFDVAYVFREASLLGPPVFERWLHRAGLPYVFDFDDATWLPPPRSPNGYLSLLKYPPKTKTCCRLAP